MLILYNLETHDNLHYLSLSTNIKITIDLMDFDMSKEKYLHRSQYFNGYITHGK